MREIARLCKRLNREVVGTYCVTKSNCLDCSGRRLYVYSVYYCPYRHEGVYDLEGTFYSLADTKRFLLDQFLF